MKQRVLFDTNVILDIIAGRADALASFIAYDVTLSLEFTPLMLASCTTDIAYLLQSREYLPTVEAHRALGSLFEIFDTVDTLASDCQRAYASKMEDYEDAVKAHAAERAGANIIVTRNKKDFAKSPVPALTPQEFAQAYKPIDVDYAEVDFCL